MELEDALSLYLAEVQPPASVVQALVKSWPKFIGFCQSEGLQQLEEITSSHIVAFHEQLQWQPGNLGRLYSANSVDQFMRRVRQVIRWIFATGHLTKDPTARLKLPRTLVPQRGLLSWQELERFYAGFNLEEPMGLRDAAICLILMETPIGVCHALQLVVGQESLLDLQTPTRELVQAYRDEARPLFLRRTEEKTMFLTRAGGPVTRVNGYRITLRAARAVGITTHVTSQILRASYLDHLERQAHNRHFSFNRNGL